MTSSLGSKKKMTVALVTALALVVVAGVFSAYIVNASKADAAGQSRILITQKTATSAPDPLPGHASHQLVMVAAPRADGELWDGDVTWTASKPVEVVVLHSYDNSTVDATHGDPLIAPFGNGNVAITLYTVPSNSPVNSGSTHFDGTAMAFHNLNGEPFTVTYTVKATAFAPRE